MHPFEDAAATAVERRDGERVMGLDDGDEVSGRGLLVATGRAPRMYQDRITARDIAGGHPGADCAAIPRVVFSDPEVAAVG